MKRILKDPEPEDKVDGRSFNIRSRKKMEREVRRLTYTSARADKTKGIRSKKGKKFGLYTDEDMGIGKDESTDAAQPSTPLDDMKPKATEAQTEAQTEAHTEAQTDQPGLEIVNEKGACNEMSKSDDVNAKRETS